MLHRCTTPSSPRICICSVPQNWHVTSTAPTGTHHLFDRTPCWLVLQSQMISPVDLGLLLFLQRWIQCPPTTHTHLPTQEISAIEEEGKLRPPPLKSWICPCSYPVDIGLNGFGCPSTKRPHPKEARSNWTLCFSDPILCLLVLYVLQQINSRKQGGKSVIKLVKITIFPGILLVPTVITKTL